MKAINIASLFSSLSRPNIGCITPITNIVTPKSLRQPNPPLMKRRQTQNTLGNTQPLPAEYTPQSKLLRIIHHLLTSLDNTNSLTVNLGSLHNYLQTTQRIGYRDINRGNGRTGQQSGGKIPHAVMTQFLLDILLKLGLSRQP